MATFDLSVWCSGYYQSFLLTNEKLIDIAAKLQDSLRIDKEELDSLLSQYIDESRLTDRIDRELLNHCSQFPSRSFVTENQKWIDRFRSELASNLPAVGKPIPQIESSHTTNLGDLKKQLAALKEEMNRRIQQDFAEACESSEEQSGENLIELQTRYHLSDNQMRCLQTLGIVDYEPQFRHLVSLSLSKALPHRKDQTSHSKGAFDGDIHSLLQMLLSQDLSLSTGESQGPMDPTSENKQDSIRERRFRLLRQDTIEALQAALEKRGLIRTENNDSFWVNHEVTAYLLAKKAFQESWKRLSLQGRVSWIPNASHWHVRPRILLDRTRDVDLFSDDLDITETMERSLIRRKVMGRGQILSQEDLSEFVTHRFTNCRLLVALDTSQSMKHQGRMRNAREACLALAYYVHRYHRYDRIDFVQFDREVRGIPLSKLPGLDHTHKGCTRTAKMLAYAIDRLGREKKREKILYLITDGVPTPTFACEEHEWLSYGRQTVEMASALPDHHIHFVQIFLGNREKDEENFHYSEQIAREITRAGRGLLYRVVESDDIASLVLESYIRLTRL